VGGLNGRGGVSACAGLQQVPGPPVVDRARCTPQNDARIRSTMNRSLADDLVLQVPEAPAQQLVLLWHGRGATPWDLLPLGQRLANAYPAAWVVSVRAPDSHPGGGWQWFESVMPDDDAVRAARVAAALPAFEAAVAGWRERTGLDVEATSLVGFSQGAAMALESTQRDAPPLAGRIVAIAGRLSQAPQRAPVGTTLHLIHGKQDAVVPYAHTVRAAEALIALGGDVTADVIPFLGHTIDDEVIDLVLERLSTYLPRRRWDEALRSAPS
jgi:phospholipase/carboxylesterase